MIQKDFEELAEEKASAKKAGTWSLSYFKQYEWLGYVAAAGAGVIAIGLIKNTFARK